MNSLVRSVIACSKAAMSSLYELPARCTWARGILSKQQRSLNVLCITAALNRPNEFKLHFRGALNNGCSLDDLRETLLQIAAYCGAPAGVEAFRLPGTVVPGGAGWVDGSWLRCPPCSFSEREPRRPSIVSTRW